MFNVCSACGMYTVEKEIQDGEGWRAWAICPTCGHAQSFLRLPLLTVTGASGTGKSTLAQEMAARDQTFVHLESDILWMAEFDRPEEDYRTFRNTWLRLCKHIAQAGRPVALYGSLVPSQLEACPERRYIGPIHLLALVCEPETLAARLRARPAWRNAGSQDFIERMQRFNSWFLEHAGQAETPMTLLDTTHISVADAVFAVQRWALERWNPGVTREEKVGWANPATQNDVRKVSK